MNQVTCAISGKVMNIDQAYNAGLLRQQLFNLIRSENPQVTKESYLDPAVVDKYRGLYLSRLISEETGDTNSVEQRVILAIQNNEIITDDLREEAVVTTFGARLADKIASFGGSWYFISIFITFIIIWMIINAIFLMNKSFDPYPFILLNLILSCLGALQAPIIMMSQNRQSEKDRIRAEHDYMVNLKAELEIKLLHEKLDHLMVHQHMRLLEIQQVQVDYLKDILEKIKA